LAALVFLAAWAEPARLAQAANPDTTADHVLGQPDFAHNAGNNGGLSATSLYFPAGVALDAQGNLYVADTSNSRVLEYDTPLTYDTTAAGVFGPPDFIHKAGGLSATSLFFPTGVALDAHGNLYVADANNNRVLESDWALVKTNLPQVNR
jgi:sugar lactone lactonase YvrE